MVCCRLGIVCYFWVLWRLWWFPGFTGFQTFGFAGWWISALVSPCDFTVLLVIVDCLCSWFGRGVVDGGLLWVILRFLASGLVSCVFFLLLRYSFVVVSAR